MQKIISQTTEDKLLLAAEIIREKGRWEWVDVASQTNPRWIPGNGVVSQLLQAVSNKNFRVRKFQGMFPELPAGHSWYNPWGILPVQLPEKFRLLTTAESYSVNKPNVTTVLIGDNSIQVVLRDTPICICSPIYPYKQIP